MRKLFFLLVFLQIWSISTTNTDEEKAQLFLTDVFENEMSKRCNEARIGEWNYNTNITDDNEKKMLEAQTIEANYIKEVSKNISTYKWQQFSNKTIHREFKFLSVLGEFALSSTDFQKYQELVAQMSAIYSKATICDKQNKCGLRLEPEITDIMSNSRDPDQLLQVWTEWHNNAGRPMRDLYPNYVELGNKAAKENGFANKAKLWLYGYEDDNFDDKVVKLWNQVKPLYEQLHAFVRRKLHNFYKDKVSLTGPIPAHLLGNMWAQSWASIADIVIPFPSKNSSIDATSELKKRKYTPHKMFKAAEEFYTSLGLEPLSDSFWKKSMLTRPEDGTEVVCHASAWDFCNRQDFRIKMCTTVTMENFITIHHEMGHIQYFQQYRNQPIIFRTGANPGFHEAVGDTIALSASSISHMTALGFIDKNVVIDKEFEMNELMVKALEKIAFLPFGYVCDLWRWKVFNGTIDSSSYNSQWWKLRKIYQGIEPSIPRTESDFDPGAKYHIAADVEYLRYFVAAILQFQFHRSLCIEANEYEVNNDQKPLHRCDIYKNQKAGTLLKNMLSMGASQKWPNALKKITGVEDMDASALLEYFKPLHDYLIEENKKNHEKIGWTDNYNSSPGLKSSLLIVATTYTLCKLIVF